MKQKTLFLLLAFLSVSLMSCNDEDDSGWDVVPAEIASFIKERYPQSVIVEVERGNGAIEVDIVHNKQTKEVVFNIQNQWLYTSWEIRIAALPQLVASVTDQTLYEGYRIDDARFVESPQGDFYLLELEKGTSEIKIKVDEQGNILS